MGMQGDRGGGGRLEARTVETRATAITRQSLISVDDIFFRSGFGFRYGYGVRLSVWIMMLSILLPWMLI